MKRCWKKFLTLIETQKENGEKNKKAGVCMFKARKTLDKLTKRIQNDQLVKVRERQRSCSGFFIVINFSFLCIFVNFERSLTYQVFLCRVFILFNYYFWRC